MHDSAFDGLASEYDATFSQSPVGTALRGLVWARLDELFRTAGCVLDLGCGTGEDALRLAARGVRVVALDASAAMLERTRTKARRQGLEALVDCRCLPMERLAGELPPMRFDGVLSNFGALNCVADLPALIAAVAGRLSPGARLLWVPMGRRVPWEWTWYLARGRPRIGLRRLRRERLPWRGLTLGYPSPRTLAALLEPRFRIDAVRPLGVALPPTYATAWLERHPRVLALLSRAERAAQGSSALAAWADHYLIEATYRGESRP